ncbi:MAG: hypothetical protein RBU29_11090, partial [bacterium]|nr:hypothetical protein [bacterium]
SAAGRLYNKPELVAQAERLRETIRKQAFDGQFFLDNALRKDGKLEVTQNHTEVCQYFAFYFGVATPEAYPELWAKLQKDFGPQRRETKAFPDVPFANSFIGNVLRMEILSRYGHAQQILDESIAYQLYMVDRTGTLWENVDPGASCNHGFASHTAHVLYRDVLGIYAVDPLAKTITLRFADVNLDWCEGILPLADGEISLRWWREDEEIQYQIDYPAGYTLQVLSLGKSQVSAVH